LAGGENMIPALGHSGGQWPERVQASRQTSPFCLGADADDIALGHRDTPSDDNPIKVP
jgi:hypothetical protein